MTHIERGEGEEVGRGVVPGRHVRVSSESARVGAPRPAGPCPEPRVELIRDGDVVAAIDVTCACGRRIRVRCLYS